MAASPALLAVLSGAVLGLIIILRPPVKAPGAASAASDPASPASPAPEATGALAAPAPAPAPAPPPLPPGHTSWSPDDARSTKVAVRCAIDTTVLACIALAIVAVAWQEQRWGSLLDVLDRVRGIFPNEVAFVKRLLA